MMRRERLLGPTLGLFCTVAQLYPSVARAEDASAAETGAARSLAVDGLKLAQANNCADAVPKLERAEKLYHSAVVASRLGECDINIGRLVEGTEILRKVLREPQPAEPTPALVKALERAQRVLDAAKPRIAGLTVKVVAVQDMSVKIDGVAVPSALVDTEIPTDPGDHAVDVSAPGFLKSGTRISVAEGERKTVSLTLSRDPNAVIAPAPTAAAAAGKDASAPPQSSANNPSLAASASAPEPHAPNRTAAYLSLGVGAAGVVAGSVLGLMTIQQHKDLQNQCPNNVCAPGKQDDLSSAKHLGNFSTVAFGVGGAGLLLGTVLFFTATPSNADHAQTAAEARFAGLTRPRLDVGLGHVVFDAQF
jgi:hypothetical protein